MISGLEEVELRARKEEGMMKNMMKFALFEDRLRIIFSWGSSRFATITPGYSPPPPSERF
jgi:hypothetical protein